jgi:hypothetical protein
VAIISKDPQKPEQPHGKSQIGMAADGLPDPRRRAASETRENRARVPGARIRITGEAVVVPSDCACCLAPASRTDKVTLAGRELFVGYCDACARHQGAVRIERLAVVVASGVLAATLAAALPLLPREGSLFTLFSLVVSGALLPVGLAALCRRKLDAGHAASGLAVRARNDALECANPTFAEALARANGAETTSAPFREARVHPAFALHLVWAPLLAWFVSDFARPIVRIVNLTGDPISVEVDGAHMLSVAPTSVESPSAGAEVRIPAGRRNLIARRENGEQFETSSVEIELGKNHLYAPGSAEYCFWLEESALGRRGAGVTHRERLEGPPYFWALPDELGGWFAPAPASIDPEAKLSGGVITVLRQAPCDLFLGGSIGK